MCVRPGLAWTRGDAVTRRRLRVAVAAGTASGAAALGVCTPRHITTNSGEVCVSGGGRSLRGTKTRGRLAGVHRWQRRVRLHRGEDSLAGLLTGVLSARPGQQRVGDVVGPVAGDALEGLSRSLRTVLLPPAVSHHRPVFHLQVVAQRERPASARCPRLKIIWGEH